MREEADRRTITLVGQSRSGKTNLLSALLYNPNGLEDIKFGPDPVENPAISTLALAGSPEEKSFHSLSVHQRNILRGRDFGNEGTDQVRGYPALLEFDDPKATQVRRGWFGGGQQVQSPIRSRLAFTIVDGRGGDIAPSEYIDPNDPDNESTISRVVEYRDGLDNSVGMVICMPIVDTEFQADVADKLVREVTSAIHRKAQTSGLATLKHVALVFTKYDALFAAEGASAGQLARSPDKTIRLLKGQAIMRRFTPIFHQAQAKSGFQALIFPASTFGFVAGDGPANYYKYQMAPGLLGRAVDAEDYADPDLNEEGQPGLRDHFPIPMPEKEALTLWQPFNIAPPILFALTGRVTGPLVLRPEDLL